MFVQDFKEILPDILERVKEKLYKDEIFSLTYGEKEKDKIFEILVNLLNEYIDISIKEENCDIKYIDIAKYHLPFFVILRALNLIKHESILYLNNNDSFDILEIENFIQKALNLVALMYINLDIDKLKNNSKFDEYLLFYPHINLNKKIIYAVKNNCYDDLSFIRKENCEFDQLMNYPESLMVCMDINLCSLLHELHNLLHKHLNTFFRFLLQKNYVQAYLVLKDLIEVNHKFFLTIKDLYYATYNNLEVSFFKLVEMLEYQSTKETITLLDIKNLKKLNNIYGEEVLNQILFLINKYLNQIYDKYKSSMLIIKGISSNFYLLNLNWNDEDLKKLFEEIYKNLPKKFEIKSQIIEIEYILASFSLDRNIKYDKDDLIRIVLHLKNEAKKSNNFKFIYQQKDKEDLIKWLKDKFFNINKINEKLKKEEIDIMFQPIFDKDLRIYSTEVLARIIDNNRLINAGLFIDVLYEMNKIVELDRIVLKKILEKKEKLKNIPKIFINASPLSIIDELYISELIEFINLYGKDRIIIEITEQQALNSIDIIMKIHEKTGVNFAIDDFGSGFTALKTVVDLINTGMIKILKIDGEIIKNIYNDEKMKQVVEIVNDMCKRLNILSLGEFVEDKKTMNILKNIGVDLFQGYYLSTPIKIEELMVFELNLK